jgi:hypothetical protein
VRITIWDNGRLYSDHALVFINVKGYAYEEVATILRSLREHSWGYDESGIAAFGEMELMNEEGAVPLAKFLDYDTVFFYDYNSDRPDEEKMISALSKLPSEVLARLSYDWKENGMAEIAERVIQKLREKNS